MDEKKSSYSLSELAQHTNSKLIGDSHHQIRGVEDLEAAESHHASFFENAKYKTRVGRSQAGVVLVLPEFSPPNKGNFLLNSNPSFAFQKVIELFIPPTLSGFSKVHPSAVVHKTAVIGKEVSIGPYVVIDRGVKIGDCSVIDAGSLVGAEATIGVECHLHANVVVRERCHIGNRVVVQPGAVIGSSGFGYFTDKEGNHFPLQQLGEVVIEDDVEIGANTTIDRARFKTTRIGKGTKIDNLVQIAHQVSLGENNLIVSQVGIAGSTKTGRNVVMGGQTGINGHITITDGVILAARSAVSKSLKKSGVYYGIPAMPIKEFKEQFFQQRSLGKFIKAFKILEAKIAVFEKEASQVSPFRKWFKKTFF